MPKIARGAKEVLLEEFIIRPGNEVCDKAVAAVLATDVTRESVDVWGELIIVLDEVVEVLDDEALAAVPKIPRPARVVLSAEVVKEGVVVAKVDALFPF